MEQAQRREEEARQRAQQEARQRAEQEARQRADEAAAAAAARRRADEEARTRWAAEKVVLDHLGRAVPGLGVAAVSQLYDLGVEAVADLA